MKIRCAAIDCLHNEQGMCGVSDDTVIDVSREGRCFDHSPVTDSEYREITGRDREPCIHPETEC